LGSVAEDEEDSDESESETSTAPQEERDFLTNPYWIEDPDLKKGEVDYLSSAEILFWKDLIDKYLYPIDQNKDEQARIAKDLKELRDSSVFAFFMINALFVLIVFLLQLNKDSLHIKWPLGVKTNITYDETTQEVHISKEYLQLEPIGLVFVFFFALILVIQFTAMLFHRFGTLAHILASTELNLTCQKKAEDLSQDALIDKHAVEIVKNLQRLQGIDGDYDNDSGSGPDRIARRRTVHNLEKASKPRRQIGTLDVAFKKRFLKLTAEEANSHGNGLFTRQLSMRRETIRALEHRKNSVMAEKRKSQMQTLGAHNEYGMTGSQPAVVRPARPSLAGSVVNIKDVFDMSNGGPHAIYGANPEQQIYGVAAGNLNQGYEHVLEEDERNSLRLTPRNQVSWSNTNGR